MRVSTIFCTLMLPLSRNELERRSQTESFQYLLFYGHTPKRVGVVDKSCFSQWYESSFVIDGVCYKTAEHYMMASKAMLFQPEAVEDIISAPTPKTAKELGRCVENFDNDVWTTSAWDIVIRGNIAKFSQNDDLCEYLLATEGKILVEASPHDRIWGIGMNRQNQDAQTPHLWKGENLLGFALVAAREEIRRIKDFHDSK